MAIFRRHENGKAKLQQTRTEVIAGWNAIAQRYQDEGTFKVADEVRIFSARIPRAATDQERLATKFLAMERAQALEPLERTR